MAFPFIGSSIQARGDRRKRRLEAKQRHSDSRLVFEPLEPRVLLSADPLSISLGGDAAHPMAHDVIIESVTQSLPNADHTTVQMVQVVDRAQSNAVLASAPVNSISGIQIASGTGNTSLTVDTTSFGGTAVPGITFHGGNGNNSLVVAATGETDWNIAAPNAGTVSGSAAITFSGVSNLTGGTNNTDVFTVTPGGALSGTLDGGPGGNDSLVFNNVSVNSAAFTASGPHSGTVNLDGSLFTYAGLEPITLTGNAANITVGGTGGDVLSLADTATPGQIEVASQNNSLESVTFTRPTASLTLDLNGGTDSVQIGELRLSGASLTVDGGGGTTSISVDPGAYVSTRQTVGDALGDASFGNSGSMSLNAATITVNAGAMLYANANSGFSAGDIALDGTATGGAGQPADAGVAVHGAQIIAGNVTLDTAADAQASVTQQTLATLDLSAAAQTQIDGTSVIGATTGSVDIGANVDAIGQVTANAAPLGVLNADAAVALAHVDATASVDVSGNSLVVAINTLNVESDNTTQVTTLADGSAGGASALGGAVALSDVNTGSTVLLDAGVRAFAGSIVLGADSTTTVTTNAIATAGGATANGANGQGALTGTTTPDGSVTVGAAIAGATVNDTASASSNAKAILTTRGFSVSAGASREVATEANATDVQGGPGVGAAVALNAISADSNASLGGQSAISGDAAISVGQLRTPDVFGAIALSGVGATNVGVAGALAVNGVSDNAFGGIAAGANVTMATGSLTTNVVQNGDAVTAAVAFLQGASPGPGVGASVAIAPVHFSAEAGVQAGAELQVGDPTSLTQRNASFTVTANRLIDTAADGGTAGGTGTAAALALTMARDDAGADLDTGALVTVQGNLLLTATQTSKVNTTATAESGAQAAVASFGIALDDTQATSAAQVTALGDVTLTAIGETTSTTRATGGPAGALAGGPAAPALIAAELGFLGNQAGVTLPTPASADGVFGVAAAMALGVTIGRVSATVSPVSGAAEAMTAQQIRIDARGSVAATTRADASTDSAGTGVAAALALQTGQAIVVAEDDAPITAPVIFLSAGAPFADIPVNVGNFTVQAISGAGAGGVGVAGAMAIGGDSIKVQSLLNGAATASSTVILAASGRSSSDVDATALTASLPLGVGASFALDVTDATVTAAIEDGGSVAGVPTLSLGASGGQDATTTAEGGAVGGTATGAAFALAVVTDEIVAQLTTKAVAAVSQASLTANGASSATTTAAGNGGGQSTAVGAGLALGILVDDVAADVAGRLAATGSVGLTATGVTTEQTTADAGSRGAAAGGLDAAMLLGSQLAFLNDPNGVIAPTLATADGALGVAAALAFGVDDATTETVVSGRLGALGGLTMTATGGTTADSTANAEAVDDGLGGTGIAAAVAVMVATPKVSARIDGTVLAEGATLTAGMAVPAGQVISSHAISGVGGNDTGVAGAFALTIGAPETEAAIGGTGRLDLLQTDATLSATGVSAISATAAAANLGAGTFGLGASVALDIALDDTHARLEQGAQVIHALDLTLVAEGTESSVADALAGSASGGVAGSVAINVAPQDVAAEIDPGAALSVAGNLSLDATQSQTSRAHATGGTSGRGGGFGAAIAVNAPVADTTALLDRGAAVGNTIQVTANGAVNAQAVATAGEHGGPSGNTADQDVARWLGAAGSDSATLPPVVPNIANALGDGAQQLGLSLPDVGSAAALGVDAAFGTTSASIGGGAAVSAGGNILVQANGSGTADARADANAVNDAGAVGFGFAVDYDAQTIEASIGTGTPITAPGLTVEADVPRNQVESSSAEATAGSGASASAAGAIALNLVSNTTDAQVLGTAPIQATNFIDITAMGDTAASATAGYELGGGVAGAGVSLAANLVVDHTEASVVAGADLESLGSIRIDAEGAQSLASLSAGGASAGVGEVAASLTADTLLATTAASVGKGAQIDTGTVGAGATQELLILARDDTTLDSAAGSLGASVVAGAGAAAQFSDLVKQTTADLDGTVSVAGSVVVDAESTETGLTAADAGTLSAVVNVAGGAGMQLGQLLTHAAIAGDANVHALGDVAVTAVDNTEMDVIAGSLDASLVAAAGAGIGAIGLIKTTEALVEDNAVVDAQGEGNGTQVATGFAISFVPDNPAPGEVAKPFLPSTLTDIFSILLNNPIHNLLSPVGSIPSDDFSSSDRVATPVFSTIHGLAVTALSHDNLAIETSGLGAAGLASLELSASGIAAQPTTRAEINAGAQINQSGFFGSAAQSVLVSADGDTQAMGIAGSLPVGGVAAVGPATALLAIHPDVEAFIGAGAKVTVLDGVTVQALSVADLLTDATSGALSLIGVAGSADALVLGGHTCAYIDSNATVIAGGSVDVLADDSSTSQNVAGALEPGATVAAGGSAAISLVAKDTEAWIGANAQVYSLGASGEAIAAISFDPSAVLDLQLIRGVSVLAVENQLVMDLVANGAGGSGGAAFIGSAAGVVIGNTTAAFIADGATVRAGMFDSSGQPLAGSIPKSISVGALDLTHSWDGIANVVDADLAISGAADAGVIRDTTDAKIQAGAVVTASGDVGVASRSAETVDSFVGGLGLTNGGIELNVSASVYSIGAVVPGDLLDPLSVVGGAGNLEGYLDGLLQGMVDQAGQGLVGVLNKYAAVVGGQQAAATQLAGLTPSMPVTNAFTATSAGTAGTVANVDAATVTAFGKVQVTAIDNVTPDLDTSFTFSHSFGNNSQNLNLSLDGGLLAGRANATASVTGASQVQAAGDIDVTGDASTTQNVNSTFAFNSSTGNAAALVDGSRLTAGGAVSVSAEMDGSSKYSGLMPGFNGLKLRTSYNHEVNSTTASVTDGSVIEASGAVTVSAVLNSAANVKADGATLLDDGFAGVVSLGVALAWNDLENTTAATIDNSHVLADSVGVTATATTTDFTFGFGAADGSNNQVAIGGSAARNILGDTVSATIESALVIAPHGVTVDATDTITLTALSGAAAARSNIGLGGAVSLNTTTDQVTAEIGASEVDVANGSIQVEALGTANMSALAAGFAQGKNVAVGAGLPLNTLDMTIAASVLNNSDLTVGGDVTVSATGDGTIEAAAGGVAIATNQFGAGAAVAVNNSSETVSAEIGESLVTAGGNVAVVALSDPTIMALAIGFAYAPTVGLGASVSTNNINDTVSAAVDNQGGSNSNVFASGGIDVSAIDKPDIEVLTGGVAISSGQVAASASVSKNNIGDTVNATISGARLTALAGPIIVQGVADPTILAIAIAGSGAQGYTGNGAISVNTVGSTVNVTVGDQQAVLIAPVVSISGADNSNIGAVAFGIAAAGTGALSGDFADNEITGGMLVQVEGNGRVTASTALVTATNNATIQVITGSAEGAGTASLGGAVSINNITDYATTQIVGSRIDAHSVTVTASQTGLIKALAAVGNGAGTAAFGASVTTNNIYDAATAIITLGAVINTGAGGSLTLASTNSGEIDSFSGAVSAAGTAEVSAAVANNNISVQDANPDGANTELLDSTVTGGAAMVEATDSAKILSTAISGGGAGTAAFGGSVAKANGNNTTTVSVTDNTEKLTGAFTVAALDTGTITTAAANAEGAGTAAGGAAVAINTLTNNVSAVLSGGTARAGSVSVTATGMGTLGAVGAIGSGAGTIALDVSDTENTITGSFGAGITGGAVVTANGAVLVSATDQSSIQSLSGAADGAGTVGGAGARAHNRIGDVPNDSIASDPTDTTPSAASTTATIDGGSVVAGKTIAVNAAFDGSIKTAAIAGAGAGTAAVAGSLTDNLIGDQVSSTISGAATQVFANGLGTGALDVNATNNATIQSLAGAVAGSGAVAIGASGAVNKLRNEADATVDGALVWSLTGDVSLSATGGGMITSIAAAGDGAATVALSAAVSLNDIQNNIAAQAIDGAVVIAAHDINLISNDGGTIESNADALAVSGGASIGGAVATNNIADQVTAGATDSNLRTITDSVDISAAENASIESLSAALSGGTVGISAAVSVNEIGNALEATVDASTVDAGNGVTVESADTSNIKSAAINVAAGVAAVGGGAAYNQIENTIAAAIGDGSSVTATSGDVLVEAGEDATINTLAAGAAGGAAGIGGSVSVSVITNSVEADILNSTVTAFGNVGVIAQDSDTINGYGGQVSAGVVGVAGSVAVLTLESQIGAAIEGSTVAANGGTLPLSAPDIDPATGNAAGRNASGVVVVARDLETATVLALTFGGGLAAIAGTVSDVHTATVTDAHIAGSQINSANHPGSGVFVHATQATSVTGTLGTGAVGFVAVGASVQVTTIDNKTQAYISDHLAGREGPPVATGVYANTIDVSTATYETVTPTTIGVTGGAVAISGSVAYTDITSSSNAYVRDSLLQAKHGAANITVAAEDNANVTTFAGNFSAGFVGAGAAVGVSSINDTTLATLIGARLDANGAITVSAASTGNITDIAVGGSGGVVGIAGSVLVDHINTDTEASTRSDGAQATLINQDPGFSGKPGRDGGSTQSVNIIATGNETIDGTAGAVAVGLGAAGAGIHVGGIADFVAADVEGGTAITAAGNVSVTANDQRNVSSDVIAGAAGLLGLSGAFSVISIGGAFDPTTANQVNASGSSNADQLVSNANSSISETPASSGINTGDSPVAANAVAQLNNQPAPTVGNDLFAAPGNVSGTFATVDSTGSGGAPRIKAGGNITISATDGLSLSVTDGSASGGLLSVGVSVGLATVTDTVTASATGAAVLSAGGKITIDANDSTAQPGTVSVTTGQGGAIAIGGAVGDATLHLNVTAALGPDVTVQRAASVNVNAVQTAVLTSTGLDVTVGLAFAGGVVTSTLIDGSVAATVGQGSLLGTQAPIGTLTIAATGGDIGIAETTAGSGGIVGGEFNAATAIVKPAFSANLGDQTTSNVAGAVSITADTTGVAQTSAEGVSIGLGAIGLSNADAELYTSASANIGNGALVLAGGDVSVTADHTTTAATSGMSTGSGVSATANSSGGGGISGNGATATAIDQGAANATVGSGTNIQAGGTLRLRATAANLAQANANTLSLGFAAIGGQVATSKADGKATAELGDGTTVHAYALEVEAAANDAAQSNSVAAAGGVFGTSVGSEADADASPMVTAMVGNNANVSVLTTVDILATAEPSANSVAQGTSVSGFYAGGSSNANTTGNPQVDAEIGQNSLIQAGGGVQVMAQSPKIGEISNGTFDASNATVVGLAKNEFFLVAPTLLQTGDQVVYEAMGGTPVGGLTDGRIYSVINDGNGISLGQTFSGAQVNADAGTIQFAAPDGFVTGDKVIYSSNGAPAVGGLVDGATYFVRVINSTTIKLATSLAEAIQGGLVFNASAIAAGGLITMAGNGFTNGEAVTYRSTGNSITGLVNGNTYFVQKVNASQFRLSALPGGPALALSKGSASGIQTLGAEGVALDGAGIFEQQSLTFDLTAAGTGTQQLVGVGGAAAALPATPMDAYNASAEASGGALAGDIGAQSNVTIGGQTTAAIDSNATVHSGGEISVNVTSQRPSEDDAQGSGSGFVGLGSATAVTSDTETTTAQVGAGASLVAAQDVLFLIDGVIDPSGSTQSNGGGAVKSSDANTTISADPTTGVVVGQNANVSAVGDVTMTVQGQVEGKAQSSAGGFGLFGSGSNANSYFLVGVPNGPATVSVQVGNGANLAGSNVLLMASFNGLEPEADSYAFSSGTVVLPSSLSDLELNTNALVSVGAGASITAANQVNLISSYGAGGIYTASAVTDRSGVVGKQNAFATDNQQLASNIDVAGGATITAHVLQASVTIGAPTPTVQALEGGYGGDNQPSNITQDATETRNIVFDGNAVLTAAPNPLLIVNRFGQIVDSVGVTASISSGNVVVNTILDKSPGQATFSSDSGSQYMASGSGPIGEQEGSAISGNQGSFTFVDTFQTVTLQNGSALNMVLNEIDPVVLTPAAAINIQLDDTSQFSFTLANVFQPTAITIANTPLGVGNLVLTNDIEDPIGSISLSAGGGNIVGQGILEMVRAASVSLNTGGNIGTAAQRLSVEVVDSPQAGTNLNADAGGDLHLAVRARLRDPSAFIFQPQLGNLIAGGNIDLDLLPVVRDNNVGGPVYNVAVYTQSPTYGLSGMTFNNNDWPNDAGGPQPLPPGIFASGSVLYSATYSIGLLEAGGNISVIDPDGATIGLTANVETLSPGSSISVAVSGNLSLTDTSGDMRIGTVTSSSGAVSLTALTGSILDLPPASPVPPASVKGTSITLTALHGSIGALNNELDIALTGSTGGLTATARNGINILDVSGNLLLQSVQAGGDIVLGTSAGNIAVASGATGPEVVGQDISLTAKGNIGTPALPVQVFATAKHGLKVKATGSAFVTMVAPPTLVEAGLGWSLGDGGTTTGKVKWASLV